MEETRSLVSCIEDISVENIENGKGIMKVKLKEGTTEDEAKAIKEILENMYKTISEATGTNNECMSGILNQDNFELFNS